MAWPSEHSVRIVSCGIFQAHKGLAETVRVLQMSHKSPGEMKEKPPVQCVCPFSSFTFRLDPALPCMHTWYPEARSVKHSITVLTTTGLT